MTQVQVPAARRKGPGIRSRSQLLGTLPYQVGPSPGQALDTKQRGIAWGHIEIVSHVTWPLRSAYTHSECFTQPAPTVCWVAVTDRPSGRPEADWLRAGAPAVTPAGTEQYIKSHIVSCKTTYNYVKS